MFSIFHHSTYIFNLVHIIAVELVTYLECEFVHSLMRESEQGLEHEGQKLKRFSEAHKFTKDVHRRASQIEADFQKGRKDYYRKNPSYVSEDEFWSTRL